MLIKSILSSITKIIPLPENTNTSSSLGNGSGDGLLNGISSGNGEHNYGIGNGIAHDARPRITSPICTLMSTQIMKKLNFGSKKLPTMDMNQQKKLYNNFIKLQ